MSINFFSLRSDSYFKLFSIPHIITLFLITVSIIFILLLLKDRTEKIRFKFRLIIGISAIVLQYLYLIWLIVNDIFSIKTSLPLQICSISLILVFFANITKNKFIINMLYFWGIIGGIYAILFPNLLQGFPHFRFIEFFIAHWLILLTVFYFIFIEKHFISFKDFLASYLITILYLVIIFIINIILKSNYLFLNKKPFFNSFFDYFGNYYQLWLVIALFLLFLILYIPFIIFKFNILQNKSLQKKGFHYE